MAKLKGPLFSLGASGQIAKTLVYFAWKGLNVVREHVVPANPDTAAQQTQRAYVTAAVAMVHTAQARDANPLDSQDQIAYSTLAAAKGKIMTWFNQVVKLWIDTKVNEEIPCVYSNGHITNFAVATIQAILYLNEETGSTLTHGKFYFGTSKTNLIHSVDATIEAGAHVTMPAEDLSAIMTAGKKYYWQFRPDADKPCEGADSGIYYFVAE